jgi:septal ring factor EnvC (AmiA/AmiB activator)
MAQGLSRVSARLGVLLAVLLAALPAGADSTGERLGEVERALQQSRERQENLKEQAGALEKEAEALRRQRVVAAAKIQEFEQQANRLEARLSELSEEEAEKAAALAEGRDQMSRILMALERMARFPPAAVIAQPSSPNDMVRSAVLLRSTMPRLEQQAAALKRDLTSLDYTRRDMAERKRELAQAVEGLGAERAQLAALTEKNAAARNQTVAAGRQSEREAAALSREARELRQLLEQLERDRRQREEQERAAALKPPAPRKPSGSVSAPSTLTPGALGLPAMGEIVGNYGEQTATGLSRKGIDIATRSQAQVVSPRDGTVVFAGEFRGYGELLIIEHSEGYHSLLAGMARIDAIPGQKVVAGEPVAIMAEGPGKPALYLELRRNGQPINPLPWLAARNSKVSG